MNGVVRPRGMRAFVSQLDLAILRDVGVPVVESVKPPRVRAITRASDGTITLEWTGANYNTTILYTPEIPGTDWRPIEAFITGTRFSFLVPDFDQGSGFFQLLITY
jgi:hypothetical protein